MNPIHVVVISKPGLPYLRVLDELPASAQVTLGNTTDELLPVIGTAEVLLNANFKTEPFATLFRKAPRLRWVHTLSAGVEHTLTPELIDSPIPFTNGRGVFRTSLAEFTAAAMLFFAKDLRRMLRNQEAGRWEQFDIELLQGQTLGIVGYGEIGRATAELAHAFGMRVLVLRRRTGLSDSDPLLQATYSPAQLQDMLAQCDYVLVAAPNTPETRGLVGDAAIRSMKRSAVIINVGRGPVIVEPALIQALDEGRIRGAALDVFDHEPLPQGHPFYRMRNVLLSPHCADHTADWIERAMRKFVENYKKFEAGLPLDNIVDKKAGY